MDKCIYSCRCMLARAMTKFNYWLLMTLKQRRQYFVEIATKLFLSKQIKSKHAYSERYIHTHFYISVCSLYIYK